MEKSTDAKYTPEELRHHLSEALNVMEAAGDEAVTPEMKKWANEIIEQAHQQGIPFPTDN